MRLADADATTFIYGEWCGPGIQDGVACSETKGKKFYPFAVDYYREDKFALRVYEPSLIESILQSSCPDDILVVPWFREEIVIDFIEKEKTRAALDELNLIVETIGQRDPLMYELFEIEGAGEGVVAFPLLGKTAGVYHEDEEYFSWFNFKAKSEAHRVNKQKTSVAFDPQKFASIQLFADSYCTEARFEQAFNEAVSRKKDMRLTPDFIKWVVSDIYKESNTEREASPDLDWKAISKACSSRAVMWYKSKVQEIE
jgi:hypothetical protein